MDWLKDFADVIDIPVRRGKLRKGGSTEMISLRVTTEMRHRMAEIVESRVDPEIRVYADLVRDAIDKWIVDWDNNEERYRSAGAQEYRADRVQEEIYQLLQRKESNDQLLDDLEKGIVNARRDHDEELAEQLGKRAWKLAVANRNTDPAMVKRLCEIFPEWPEQIGLLDQ